jgi:putative copper export protein
MSIRSVAMRAVLVLALALSILAALAWPSHGSAHLGHHHAVVATHPVPRMWML